MAITLTFGAPVKLDPVARDNAFSAHEFPLNRTHKTIMKGGTSGIDGNWIQEFDPTIGWLPEVRISTQTPGSDGQMRHDYNQYGDVMYVFALWNGGTFDLTALWRDGTGTFADITAVLDTPVAFAPNAVNNNRWGVTAIDNTTRDFWVFYVKEDAFALGDLWGRRFNGSTRTWDAAVNYGRPGAGGSAAGPVVADWQYLDNSIHLAVGATQAGLANADVAYKRYDLGTGVMGAAWTFLTNVAFPNELMFGVAGSEMDAMCDARDANQFYIVATHWTTNSATWSDCEVLFFEKDLSTGAYKPGVRVSKFGNQGAHWPTILVDTNGDIYFVWTEKDNGGTGFKAVWVSQRPAGATTWTTSKVADSNYENNANAADPDPEHPGIIRPPWNRPLLNLCITWGDKTSGGAANPNVYVNCALVRTEEEEGFVQPGGGVLTNKDMRMYDVPSGQLWWRLKGTDVG